MSVASMNKFEQELTEFFKVWKSDKHSRYLSWEHCYHFFLDNKSKILNEKYNNKENDLLVNLWTLLQANELVCILSNTK